MSEYKFCERESERELKVHKVCSEIIDHLLAQGWKVQVRRKDVEKAIMQIRGIDERTVSRWLKALITFEYLIPTSTMTYRLNPLRIPELFNNLREKPQTKIQ